MGYGTYQAISDATNQRLIVINYLWHLTRNPWSALRPFWRLSVRWKCQSKCLLIFLSLHCHSKYIIDIPFWYHRYLNEVYVFFFKWSFLSSFPATECNLLELGPSDCVKDLRTLFYKVDNIITYFPSSESKMLNIYIRSYWLYNYTVTVHIMNDPFVKHWLFCQDLKYFFHNASVLVWHA